MNNSILNQSGSLFSDILHDPQESFLTDNNDMGEESQEYDNSPTYENLLDTLD